MPSKIVRRGGSRGEKWAGPPFLTLGSVILCHPELLSELRRNEKTNAPKSNICFPGDRRLEERSEFTGKGKGRGVN